MTVVAAIASAGRVFMAADTVSQYHGTLVQGAKKIRRVGFTDSNEQDHEVLIAASGNGGIISVLPMVEWPDPPVVDAEGWIAWGESVALNFTKVLANLEPPLTATSGDGNVVQDGAYLLGAFGRLWYLFTHQALMVTDGIATLGSGGDIALGVLASRSAMVIRDDQVARMAVRIACQYDPHCQVRDVAQVETLG